MLSDITSFRPLKLKIIGFGFHDILLRSDLMSLKTLCIHSYKHYVMMNKNIMTPEFEKKKKMPQIEVGAYLLLI